MRTTFLAIVGLLAAATLTTSALAYRDEGTIEQEKAVASQARIRAGDKVVIVNDEYGIRVGDTTVDSPPMGAVLTVREVRGDWLSVSRGKPGWIYVEHVIPLSQALSHFNRLIRQDNDNDELYVARAMVQQELDNYESAIDDLTTAIRLNPGEAAWYNNRGIAYEGTERYELALRDYDRSLELEDRPLARASTYRGRANCHFQLEEYDLAIENYNQAISLDPTNASSYDLRGDVWTAMEEWGKAIADDEQAIELDPGRIWSYEELAWCLATCPDAKFRDGDRAVEYATQACELTNWEDGYYIDTLAAAYAEAGNFERAIRYQQEAIQLVGEETAESGGYNYRLELYQAGRPYHRSEDSDSSDGGGDLPTAPPAPY